MPPEVFLIAFLSTMGIAAFTVIKVVRLWTTRPDSALGDVVDRLEALEHGVQSLQREHAETLERLDFAERLLSKTRDDRQIGA